jgi:predicted nucleic acid-binding protein
VVLADTSVWVEHLRRGDARLSALLVAGDILCHPMIVGELACGHIRRRAEILGLLAALPSVGEATHDEVLSFIDSHRLQGKGLGIVDMHLLASCAMAREALWTHDTRLATAAARLGVGAHRG